MTQMPKWMRDQILASARSHIFDYPQHLRGEWTNLAPDGVPFADQSGMSGTTWKYRYGNYNVGSADMPSGMSGIYYTGRADDTLEEAAALREAARQRMAERAAEADRDRISARWDSILVQLFHGVTERSRATGVPHYVNALGETVDQFGRPTKTG